MFQHSPDDRRRGDRRHHHRDPGSGRRGPGPDRMPPGLREMLGGRGRGRGMIRRGEIRPLVLAVLAARPMHGYEVIVELEARSGGRWRPSAGSVYPTLQQLADEGLVSGEDVDGRRVYTLTDEGRRALAENPAPDPWSGGRHGDAELKSLAMQVVGAALQVERMGSSRARQDAARILGDTRRAIYRLLAEDETAAPASMDEADGSPRPDTPGGEPTA